MKDVFYYEMDGKRCEYHLKDNVSFSEVMGAINSAVEMCYGEDGSFHPELEDFACEYVTLATLTDIDLPEDVNGAYSYIRAIDGVPSADADFIADGVRQRINYNTRLIMASAQSHGMNRVADMMESAFEKIGKLADTVTSMIENVGEQFGAEDVNAIQNLINSLADVKGITPEQMVAGMLEYNKAQKKSAPKKAVKAK